MTPKEKAIELRDKFYFNTSLTDLEEVKQCALILIDEVIIQAFPFEAKGYTEWIENGVYYWNEVKKQIEKICI